MFRNPLRNGGQAGPDAEIPRRVLFWIFDAWLCAQVFGEKHYLKLRLRLGVPKNGPQPPYEGRVAQRGAGAATGCVCCAIPSHAPVSDCSTRLSAMNFRARASAPPEAHQSAKERAFRQTILIYHVRFNNEPRRTVGPGDQLDCVAIASSRKRTELTCSAALSFSSKAAHREPRVRDARSRGHGRSGENLRREDLLRPHIPLDPLRKPCQKY